MTDDADRSSTGPLVGTVFPQQMAFGRPEELAGFFRALEDLGFDYVTVFDHVVGAPAHALGHLPVVPYTHEDPFHEVLVLLGFAAAVTSRLGLATGVLVLPQRQTVLAAKQLATLDLLSGGRLRVGVGVGWNPAEFAALGSRFERRGEILDEQIALLRRLWTEDLVAGAGTHHRWAEVGLAPRPSRSIPVWIGGSSPAAVRRAAAHGDGWIPPMMDTRSGEKPDVDALLELLAAESGRQVPIEGRVVWGGDASRFADSCRWWQDRRATHIAGQVRGEADWSPARHLRELERLRAALA